jgi:hypothetical protein
MTRILNTTDNYTVEITQSTDSSPYTNRLARSIKHMTDSVTKRMIRDMLYGKRPVGGNEHIHGVEDAIRKQTKAV